MQLTEVKTIYNNSMIYFIQSTEITKQLALFNVETLAPPGDYSTVI